MQIVKIAANENGAHKNQSFHGVIPEGWALIPANMELENFPFGEVTAEEKGGVMIVTGWTPGELPEPDPEPEPVPTLAERVSTLEASNAEMTEALELILSGVTE